MSKKYENSDFLKPIGAMSVTTFCERFEMSRATFYREVADGNINPVKMRGKTVIPNTEVERWWENCLESAKQNNAV